MGEIIDFESKKDQIVKKEEELDPSKGESIMLWPKISALRLSKEQFETLDDLNRELRVDKLSPAFKEYQKRAKGYSLDELFGSVKEIANEDPKKIISDRAKEVRAVLNELRNRCYYKKDSK